MQIDDLVGAISPLVIQKLRDFTIAEAEAAEEVAKRVHLVEVPRLLLHAHHLGHARLGERDARLLQDFTRLADGICIGMRVKRLRADMERDNFMTAEEAVAYGLADKVIDKR
jgi:hypothetical protein